MGLRSFTPLLYAFPDIQITVLKRAGGAALVVKMKFAARCPSVFEGQGF
jgi:hypothetical protein